MSDSPPIVMWAHGVPYIRADVVSHAVDGAIRATPEQAEEYRGLQLEAETMWSIGQNANGIGSTDSN